MLVPWAAREAARLETAWMYRFGRKSTMETKVVDKVTTRVVDKMRVRRSSGGRQGEEMEAENELVRLQQAIGQY